MSDWWSLQVGRILQHPCTHILYKMSCKISLLLSCFRIAGLFHCLMNRGQKLITSIHPSKHSPFFPSYHQLWNIFAFYFLFVFYYDFNLSDSAVEQKTYSKQTRKLLYFRNLVIYHQWKNLQDCSRSRSACDSVGSALYTYYVFKLNGRYCNCTAAFDLSNGKDFVWCTACILRDNFL